MAEHTIRLEVDETGRGRTLIDGKVIPQVKGVFVETRVDHPTVVTIETIMTNVEVEAIALGEDIHIVYGRLVTAEEEEAAGRD